jgi:hypothetical protein
LRPNDRFTISVIVEKLTSEKNLDTLKLLQKVQKQRTLNPILFKEIFCKSSILSKSKLRI